jgi:CheY-like chemotaxis protein
MVIQRQLALLGYAADMAETGAKALELWRRGDYALLLSDLHMPDMDGYELTTRIRLEERGIHHIPIIALSANALKGEDDRCRAAGMDYFLSKPLQLAALEVTLRTWLGGRIGNPATSSENLFQNQHPQVVDLNVLKSFIGDDQTVIPDFLKSFQVNAARLSTLLKEACAAGQMAQTSKHAHTLKSSSHYVGALTLSSLCLEIEEAANRSDAAATAILLPKFEREFDAVNAFLNSLQLPGAGPNDA